MPLDTRLQVLPRKACQAGQKGFLRLWNTLAAQNSIPQPNRPRVGFYASSKTIADPSHSLVTLDSAAFCESGC